MICLGLGLDKRAWGKSGVAACGGTGVELVWVWDEGGGGCGRVEGGGRGGGAWGMSGKDDEGMDGGGRRAGDQGECVWGMQSFVVRLERWRANEGWIWAGLLLPRSSRWG